MSAGRASGAYALGLRFLAVAIPKLLNSAGLIAVNALLAGFLDAGRFGVLGVCTTILLVIDSVIGSAVDMGVVKLVPACLPQDSKRADAIQTTAFVMKVAAGLLAAGALWPFRERVGMALFQSTQYTEALSYTLAASIAILALRSAQASLQVTGRFGAYGTLDTISNLIKYGGVSALAFSHQVTLERVLLLYIAGPALAFLVSLFLTPSILFFRGLSWGLAREFAVLVSWFLITFGSAALAARADLFILSARTSVAEAGLFALASMVPLGAQLLGSYASVLLSPNISKLVEARQFYPFFKAAQSNVLKASAVFLILGSGAILFAGPLLLPEGYDEVARVALVMMPGATAGLATFPITLAFVMFHRPKFLFLLDCCTLPLILAVHWTLVPIYGAIGAAAISSGANVLRASLVQGLAWHWARQPHQVPLTPLSDTRVVST